MSEQRPIETRYAGCHFRSRLEARWAVFFDALNIEWEYEAQGFEWDDLGGHRLRYLPDFWLPKLQSFAEVKGSDAQLYADEHRIVSAIDWHHTPVAEHGLILLGPVPDPTGFTRIYHHHLFWEKGVSLQGVEFTTHQLISGAGYRLRWPGLSYTDGSAEGAGLPQGTSVNAIRLNLHVEHVAFAMRPALRDAYTAARSARFEHGDTPWR